MRTRFLLTAALSACIVLGTAGASLAGELTGTGQPTAGPTHASSICVFSGLNDDPTAPRTLDEDLAPNGPGGVSQSFGQDVTLGLDPRVFNPGDACRGGSNGARTTTTTHTHARTRA
jgi:hypothetical protein